MARRRFRVPVIRVQFPAPRLYKEKFGNLERFFEGEILCGRYRT